MYEVPGVFTKRHRKHESRRGKSDAIDARAIAETVLREADRLPLYGIAVEQHAMRLRYDRRNRLVGERTKAVNRLHHAALRLGIESLPASLTSAAPVQQVQLLARRLSGTNHAIDAMVDEVDEACEDIERCTRRIREIEQLLRPFVPSLMRDE